MRTVTEKKWREGMKMGQTAQRRAYFNINQLSNILTGTKDPILTILPVTPGNDYASVEATTVRDQRVCVRECVFCVSMYMCVCTCGFVCDCVSNEMD